MNLHGGNARPLRGTVLPGRWDAEGFQSLAPPRTLPGPDIVGRGSWTQGIPASVGKEALTSPAPSFPPLGR